MAISAHRIVQLCHLADSLNSQARRARRLQANLATICDHQAARDMGLQAMRLENLASTCLERVRYQCAGQSA